jgi:hypothetical protein
MKTEITEIPADGIPVEPGSNAWKMWKLCLAKNGNAPSHNEVKKAIGHDD